MADFVIPKATIDPADSTYAISPDGVRFKIRTFAPNHWWWTGGKIPILELLKPIEKKYFAVPFFFFDPRTGVGQFFESSLAPAAFPMTSYGYAKVVGYEEV
jgi:hypothetical protein